MNIAFNQAGVLLLALDFTGLYCGCWTVALSRRRLWAFGGLWTEGAVIGISQVALSALITGVFALLLKRQERGTAKQTSYIEVKIEKETVTLKAPVGASAEDIQRIVQAAQDALEKGKRIKHIAVIEEG